MYKVHKAAILLVACSAVILHTDSATAKGKDKEKHQSQSRSENTNKQSLESSRRAQERSEQRHEMHEQPGYGDPRYGQPGFDTPPNPVDMMIDQGADSLKSGARNLLPPPPPRH